MGRTLHYRVLASAPIPHNTVTMIRSVVSAMNQRFTWSYDDLSFTVIEDKTRSFYGGLWFEYLPVQAQGITLVGHDDWNACLFVRFVTWLSRILPDATVTLHDDGSSILLKQVMLEGGEMAFNPVPLALQPDVVGRRKDNVALRGFERKVVATRHGQVFAPLRARYYADLKEIAALGISQHHLECMLLEKIADRITFPWDEKPRPWEVRLRT